MIRVGGKLTGIKNSMHAPIAIKSSILSRLFSDKHLFYFIFGFSSISRVWMTGTFFPSKFLVLVLGLCHFTISGFHWLRLCNSSGFLILAKKHPKMQILGNFPQFLPPSLVVNFSYCKDTFMRKLKLHNTTKYSIGRQIWNDSIVIWLRIMQ